MTTFDHWNIDNLRNHHFNAEVFGELQIEADCTAFVDSVKQHGILQPLVIAADGTIIAGHRRMQAAARAGLQDVPVLVRRDLTDPVAIDRAWFETNRNREMTVEQKARWFAKREAIEADAARRREMCGTANPAKNFAQGRAPTAADVAAAEVGMSRPTAKSALKVVRAIDTATAKGDTDTASRLRETLNTQSVSAAKREADKVTPASSGRRKKGAERSPAKIVDELSKKHIGPLVRGIDAVAAMNGGKGAHHSAANDALNTLIGELKAMREGQR